MKYSVATNYRHRLQFKLKMNVLFKGRERERKKERRKEGKKERRKE